MAKKSVSSANKNNTASTTSASIQQQTEEYLKGGGEINVIKTGISSFNPQKGNKHITITSNKTKS